MKAEHVKRQKTAKLRRTIVNYILIGMHIEKQIAGKGLWKLRGMLLRCSDFLDTDSKTNIPHVTPRNPT